ncbi:hypothetical protein ACMC56_11975 [Campylobacterota bacterium DY0563]
MLLNKNKQLIILLLFITFAILIHFLFGFSGEKTSGHSFASDDAFITYRYAENLFLGNGIVFNLQDRVEGYSNFLYLLLMSLGFFFTTKYIYIYSVLINTLFLFATLYIFYKLIKSQFNDKFALLSIALLGLNPAIWANVNTGLETIFTLFIFVSFWYVLKNPPNQKLFWLFLLSFVSILLRVDGFILPIIVVIYLFLASEKKLAIKLFVFILFVMAVYTLFRIVYYDDFIANTYYAKASGDILKRVSSGLLFLYEESFFNGFAFYFLFIFYFIFKNLKESFQKLISFELVFCVIWLLYIIYIGGDIYQERFLLVFLVLGIYFFIFFISNQNIHFRYFLVSIAFLLTLLVFFKDGRFFYEKKDYDMWTNMGLFLDTVPKNYTLAIDAAGKIPFYSKLHTLDMLGLNDKYIGKLDISGKNFSAGHSKFDVDYTLSKKPELIASWINKYQDMFWGLSKQRYEKEYVLKYLINTSRKNLKNNIYDVENISNNKIKKLINKGFFYAVLARKDISSKLPYAKSTLDFSDLLKEVFSNEKLNHTSKKLIFESWYKPELHHRWSLGDSSSLKFIFKEKDNIKGDLKLNIMTLGKQTIKFYLNDYLIDKKTINSRNKNIVLHFDKTILKSKGINTLKFQYSNPHSPNKNDKRVLAMALRSFYIE